MDSSKRSKRDPTYAFLIGLQCGQNLIYGAFNKDASYQAEALSVGVQRCQGVDDEPIKVDENRSHPVWGALDPTTSSCNR
jgi:hypothetical protein